MDDIPLETRTNVFFQQDGAPAHNAIVVQEYLQSTFGNRWMRTYGAVAWPPRSPDLTPLDFFLWGHLKNVVYSIPPSNVQDLKNKIVNACAELQREQILAATQTEVMRRLQSCMENDGLNFEQFLR
ncbi:uncharacterized protein LOC100570164 [Acyrthosiphon pisum]|uniref:Transposable element Tc3 transposase n=1 Tax=Acyrthosiphon pisum TaxID=7029 RepID=A0A8R2A7J8_ACYPI|nr:uncharacterized protein LOC100573610 [Acyrthosiphon pisum]XP_008187176.1 uncharacterized protein LOC100570164 [Acyrthosiphon pisum]|eukprot:XP_003246904.1 PREDICTED: uncharacterized protein LOC100573610 [Acyrthosiphon pisum]